MMNVITTLLSTQQEADFLLYQVARCGLDTEDVSILILFPYGSDSDRPMIFGPGGRYFGLQPAQEFFISGLHLLAYGGLAECIPDLLSHVQKDIMDVFLSMGIPEIDAKEYLPSMRRGEILIYIRVYTSLQEKNVCVILKSSSVINMAIFQCLPAQASDWYYS